ncbi:GlsB/YeaQ/YmgE family stress response membrane protein [Methylobacterium aquaticum]|uniref:GlsB/YeaQ/YmgE family stress response membrane protein n=1 Tax=Methylobacterium aquaticum TaxID=270351 RepID=UPI0019318707|nr:GlsB/YeaQ/YmgE family stress response membrane protein [Methylobacterium aquaticum]QRE74072.1 GlsB/YeaQ/YmgE family stress response membrane protein [Methylobacterium aquaticum]
MLAILWTIIIGFVAGVIAKFIMPGSANEPSGFIMTTLLGIVGAFVATFLGQVTGWYPPNEGAGLIASVVGAVVVLAIFGFIQGRRRSTVL